MAERTMRGRDEKKKKKKMNLMGKKE